MALGVDCIDAIAADKEVCQCDHIRQTALLGGQQGRCHAQGMKHMNQLKAFCTHPVAYLFHHRRGHIKTQVARCGQERSGNERDWHPLIYLVMRAGQCARRLARRGWVAHGARQYMHVVTSPLGTTGEVENHALGTARKLWIELVENKNDAHQTPAFRSV